MVCRAVSMVLAKNEGLLCGVARTRRIELRVPTSTHRFSVCDDRTIRVWDTNVSVCSTIAAAAAAAAAAAHIQLVNERRRRPLAHTLNRTADTTRRVSRRAGAINARRAWSDEPEYR